MSDYEVTPKPTFGDQIVLLLKESVLIQGTMTVAVTGVCCYMVIVGRPIPDLFSVAWSLLMGFYFGSKSNFGQRQMAESFMRSMRP